LGARFPTQFERGHEFAQGLAVEDQALQDAVHKRLQDDGHEAVLGGDGGQFRAVVCLLEAGVALTDGGLAQALAGLQGVDVRGNVVPLVHELGIRLDQADELFAAHVLLARPLLREA